MIQVLDKHQHSLKNTSKGNWTTSYVQKDLILMTFDSTEETEISVEINPSIVQYFFCLGGSMELLFPPSNYQLLLEHGESYFFYNPEKKLNPTIKTKGNSKIISIFCTLEKIHTLFLRNASKLHFLSGNNMNQKYYKKDTIAPVLEVALNQLLHPNVNGHAAEIYKFAKVLEVFSLYFSEEAKENKEYCPYLNDEDSVRKIKGAKEILIKRMGNPPTISELAEEVDLNEFRLKEGFKSLYGTTLFHYLLEYKMHKGRNLLDAGGVKVQDVAYQLGYNNPSHFISAFKNKFGVTPKKYLQNK